MKPPGGTFPGAAAGNCLLALTRRPLRRPGQPKAAAPDSCIRAVLAPGERSCIHGKPMAETGQLYFPGHSAMRCQGPGDGARTPAGAGSLCGVSVWRSSMREGHRCGEARCRRAPGWAPASGMAGFMRGNCARCDARLWWTPGFDRTFFVLPGAAGNGFCHSGTARTETYDVDAAFMLMERNAACPIGRCRTP